MNDQCLDHLLQEYISYSHVQEKLSQVIRDCDETKVMDLEIEGRKLLERLGPQLSFLVNSVGDGQSRQMISHEGVHSLIRWIEKAQAQVSRNRDAMRHWKNELGFALGKRSAQVEQEPVLENQNIEGATRAGGPTTPAFTTSSGGVASGKSTWVSPSQQTHIGQKLDRLS